MKKARQRQKQPGLFLSLLYFNADKRRGKIMRNIWFRILLPLTLLSLILTGCGSVDTDSTDPSFSVESDAKEEITLPTVEDTEEAVTLNDAQQSFSLADIPAYSGDIYVVLNNNQPEFTTAELSSTTSFESYSELDALGRCQTAYACVGQDIMPTQERGKIGEIKPSGWHTVKYDTVDGLYLYNRCHLIAYELTAENANEKNLITGTRYMNVSGMLPFENRVADFVKETGMHVLYRVTPVFEGDNLIASGVHMEAESIEDDGAGICFNVYVYNVQPYVAIDYATGDSWAIDEPYLGADDTDTVDTAQSQSDAVTVQSGSSQNTESTAQEYVLNTNTHKFHRPECASADDIKESNRQEVEDARENLINQGYDPCARCQP